MKDLMVTEACGRLADGVDEAGPWSMPRTSSGWSKRRRSVRRPGSACGACRDGGLSGDPHSVGWGQGRSRPGM